VRGSIVPSPGDVVAGYTLISALGSGGFGMVWLARDGKTGADVAIKMLRPELLQHRLTAKGPTVSERFLAEARILQGLDHPGLVKIHAILDEPASRLVAYAMEWLVGEDLSKCGPSFKLGALLWIFADVADTLGFLHQNGVVHRDVKTANIFISHPQPETQSYERVTLLDFGVAKQLQEAMLENTATGTFLGSVSAMAPESFYRVDADKRPITGAMDQWSLGVAIYQTLSGRVPFNDPSMVGLIYKIEREQPEPFTIHERFGLPASPPAVQAIVSRLLSKLPNERYPTMAELAAALRHAAGGGVEKAPRRANGVVDEEHTVVDPDAADEPIASAVAEAAREYLGAMNATARRVPPPVSTEVDQKPPWIRREAANRDATEAVSGPAPRPPHPTVPPTIVRPPPPLAIPAGFGTDGFGATYIPPHALDVEDRTSPPVPVSKPPSAPRQPPPSAPQPSVPPAARISTESAPPFAARQKKRAAKSRRRKVDKRLLITFAFVVAIALGFCIGWVLHGF
jgi:serine/threonine-protein kinase